MSNYKHNCTKGPVTAKPYLTPDEDDDPMMVYKVEGGDLQERFDALEVSDEYIDENGSIKGGEYDEAEVAAIHAENSANAELIAEAFNVLAETGMTPRELVERLRAFVQEVEGYGFIGVQGVTKEHENHFSGSPSYIAAKELKP